MNRGEINGRIDPDMILYRRKLLTFNFPVKPLKMLLRDKPQYGSNQSGVERIYEKQARYVRITDIDEYGLLKNNLGATAELVEKKYLLKNNDILFARSGATVGKAYLHKSEPVNYECFFAGYMIRFLVDDRFLLPNFLFYYTQLAVYKEWTLAIQRAAGQPNINAEEYKSLSIPLPPLEIQTEIISIFETAYNAKKQKETQAANLLASIDGYLLNELGITLPPLSDKKTYFMSNSRQVSGGRFDPKKYTPENEQLITSLSDGKYKAVTLKNLIVQSVSGDWGIDESRDGFVEALVIRSTEFDNLFNLNLDNNRVKYRFINETKLEKINLQVNDLLIEKSGGSENQAVGRIAIITQELADNYSLSFSNFIHKIRVDKTRINADYLFVLLKMIHSIKITDLMQSQTNGIRNLIMREYFNIQAPLPPLEKQTEIADHIRAIRAKAKQLQHEAKAELEQAKSVIEKMILG